MVNPRMVAYLKIFDTLPDLLRMARQQSPDPVELYQTQNTLRDDYRRQQLPFKWSTPLRHTYHCSLCNLIAPEILYELENPTPRDPRYPMRLLKVLESEIHQVRLHAGSFNEEYINFLRNIDLSSG